MKYQQVSGHAAFIRQVKNLDFILRTAIVGGILRNRGTYSAHPGFYV